jgi:hypothetical protein
MTLKASLIGLFLTCTAGAASAAPLAPPADFKIDPQWTRASPDGQTTIEQYAKINPDGDYTWQFWARRADAQALLEPEQPDYPAGFRFTSDSKWVVRMQKTGSGEQSLYLYRLDPQGFVSATAKPFDEMAWDYLWSRPESRKVKRPEYHISAGLLKGTEENYRWMGVHWPDNRYLVVGLWGEVDGNPGQVATVHGWQCRYDLQTGKFDVPREFLKQNAKALVPQ